MSPNLTQSYNPQNRHDVHKGAVPERTACLTGPREAEERAVTQTMVTSRGKGEENML